MTYRIHSPTAIFEPRDEFDETRYWPVNDLAKHLTRLAKSDDLGPADIAVIRDRIGIAVVESPPPEHGYQAQVTRAVRAIAAYRRREPGPLHIYDVA